MEEAIIIRKNLNHYLIKRSLPHHKKQWLPYFFENFKLTLFLITSLYFSQLSQVIMAIIRQEKKLNALNDGIQQVNTSPMLLLMLGAVLLTVGILTLGLIGYGLSQILIYFKQALILTKEERLTKLLMGRSSRELSLELMLKKFILLPVIFLISYLINSRLIFNSIELLSKMFFITEDLVTPFLWMSLMSFILWSCGLSGTLYFLYRWLEKSISKE